MSNGPGATLTRCPNCQTARLKPARLESNLPCSICLNCEGVLLSLVSYRQWRAYYPTELDEVGVTEEPQDVQDTTRALLCPRCTRIMLKFKFSCDPVHRLDVCTHCEDVWLDRGEWECLKVRELHGQLPSVFTALWQRRLWVAHISAHRTPLHPLKCVRSQPIARGRPMP